VTIYPSIFFLLHLMKVRSLKMKIRKQVTKVVRISLCHFRATKYHTTMRLFGSPRWRQRISIYLWMRTPKVSQAFPRVPSTLKFPDRIRVGGSAQLSTLVLFRVGLSCLSEVPKMLSDYNQIGSRVVQVSIFPTRCVFPGQFVKFVFSL
jgi:hypothetical protein